MELSWSSAESTSRMAPLSDCPGTRQREVRGVRKQQPLDNATRGTVLLKLQLCALGIMLTAVGITVSSFVVGPAVRTVWLPHDFGADYESWSAFRQAALLNLTCLALVFLVGGALLSRRLRSSRWAALWFVNPITILFGVAGFRLLWPDLADLAPYEYYGYVMHTLLVVAAPVISLPASLLGARLAIGRK